MGGEWKMTTNAESLAGFCNGLCDGPVGQAGPSIDAAMAVKGLAVVDVKMSELASCYSPTPNSQIFPTPQRIVEHLLEENNEVPCFLLPPNHPQHVPPHIVAFWLMSQQNRKSSDIVVDVAEK